LINLARFHDHLSTVFRPDLARLIIRCVMGWAYGVRQSGEARITARTVAVRRDA
jgi:hypothetical protein